MSASRLNRPVCGGMQLYAVPQAFTAVSSLVWRLPELFHGPFARFRVRIRSNRNRQAKHGRTGVVVGFDKSLPYRGDTLEYI